MMIDRTTLLFFDASCLIAAAGSPTGGSGFLLTLCAKGYIRAVVSTYVLIEAARNVQARMSAGAWVNYQTILQTVALIIAPVPAPLPTVTPINPKDVHVVAAAAVIKTSYLLTLDKGLLAEAQQAQLSFMVLTPGDFIKTVLPTHVEYPNFRSSSFT
jgi:predicted nucleic acid-binding protein